MIVYYAPREEKTKKEPKAKGGKHEIWTGQFYCRGAYTIFHHTRAENTTFAFLSQERKWHFWPGYGEKTI